MKTTLALALGLGAMAAGLVVTGCGPSSAGEQPDGGTSSEDAGAPGQYDTLKGTFTSTDGITSTFTGSMQAIDGNDGTGIQTTWNSVSTFTRGASGAAPPDPTAPVSSPAGDTGTFQLNITMLPGAPAAGTWSCATQASAPDPLDVAFTIKDASGGTYEVFTADTCTFTLEAPVVMTTTGGGVSVYFAHGSLTAALSEQPMGGMQGTAKGTIQATW